MQVNQCDTTHQQKKEEEKKNMIISIDAEKASDKIQWPFIIKTLTKEGIGEKHLNIIKAIYNKLIANVTLKSEKLKVIPLNLEQDKDACSHTTI